MKVKGVIIMTQEIISRIIFAVFFVLLLIVRGIFSIKQRIGMINIKNNGEGKTNFIIRRFFLGPVLGIFIFIYCNCSGQ